MFYKIKTIKKIKKENTLKQTDCFLKKKREYKSNEFNKFNKKIYFLNNNLQLNQNKTKHYFQIEKKFEKKKKETF
jgi:hypothetical protein